MTDLVKKWDRAWLGAERRSWIKGLLGAPDGALTIADRPGWVYVRLSVEGAQTVTMAKHLGRVPMRANLPVRMRLENGAFVIHGVDDFFYDAATASDTTNNYGVPAHTHAIGSGLEYEIEAQRLAPGLVRPAGGWNVAVGAFRYLSGGAWVTYAGETLSLFGARPTTAGKHRWALVSLNTTTNAAEVDVGTDEDYATALAVADLDAIDIGDNIPLGAVKLRADATTVADLSRYYDARGWLNMGGAGALADLSDTTITSPTNGEMLYYNSVTGWYNDAAPVAPENIEDLADVTFTTLSDGDYIIYDSGTGDWVNVGPPYLDDLANVTITMPADGDTLTYDDGSGEWVNTPAGSGSGGALDDLSDVDVTSANDRDSLVYQSSTSEWVNRHTGRTLITDWSFRDNTGLSTSSFAWKGNRFTPDVDVDIYALCYFGTIVAGATYQGAVITGTATPGNVATATKTASHTVGGSPASLTGAHIWLEFSSPVRLTAGTQYGLMVGRTDGAGTYQLPVAFNGGAIPSNAVPMPGLSHGAGWRVADAALTVGSTIDQATGNSMACGFRFRFPSSVY